ncbi:hypothetical protein FS749_007049 [Ceratobasidium sp. UAMH 11750]|nr:hypothetical protein FS749_007049 [Ceratobasidium sp. UAMH 11750]
MTTSEFGKLWGRFSARTTTNLLARDFIDSPYFIWLIDIIGSSASEASTPADEEKQDPVKFRLQLAQEGIPRLPDLLMCYEETGPDILADPKPSKKRAWFRLTPFMNRLRPTQESRSESKQRDNSKAAVPTASSPGVVTPNTSQAARDLEEKSGATGSGGITTGPAGPILVQIALNIVKNLAKQGKPAI